MSDAAAYMVEWTEHGMNCSRVFSSEADALSWAVKALSDSSVAKGVAVVPLSKRADPNAKAEPSK